MLSSCKHPSALTGAGMSRESGIPTYRDHSDSLWSNPEIRRLATVAGFHETPELVWEFFKAFRDKVKAAQPNSGHLALAQTAKYLSGLPIITQNVDDLHERAGSKHVIHLHGLLNQLRCSRYCQGVPSVIEGDWEQDHQLPVCPFCGANLRPNITFFGEYLHSEPLQLAEYILQRTDLLIIIGTSGMVAPASEMPQTAKSNGAKLIEINLQPSMITPIADLWIEAPAGEVLPLILDALVRQR